MILRNPLNFIIHFLKVSSKQLKNIYLNSNYYDKKISNINNNNLVYKPSPYLLSSIIKYQKKFDWIWFYILVVLCIFALPGPQY